jgi:threonine synthase
MAAAYELRCRECGKRYENAPLSICDECFSPLEVVVDLEAARHTFTRETIAAGPSSMWRYQALLPVPDDYVPTTPAGWTPLLRAPRLAERIGARNLWIKNDAVCLPTLSFKDRVVAVALANARPFGFDTVGCSSTGNLANAVAAQAARLGLKSYILVPADLEAAKILNTQVYGATLVRIDGNYDHVNRLCSQIADRYNWGFVNVNLRPYYAEGSKTVGFEIAEQLGWRLPDNVVVPMAGGSLIVKIRKAFKELIALGLVEEKEVRFFGAQATGCSPISTAVKNGADHDRAAAAFDDCSVAGDWESGGRDLCDAGDSRERRLGRGCVGRGDCVGDPGAGGDRRRVYRNGGRRDDCGDGAAVRARRIHPDELTVACITGNGLKTTDVLQGAYEQHAAIRPRLGDFEDVSCRAERRERTGAGRGLCQLGFCCQDAFQKHTNGDAGDSRRARGICRR